MKLGACVPITQYQTLVDCGYQSIALAAKDVALWSEAELSHAGKLLAHGPLEHINLNSFCPASLRLHGAGYSHDAVLQFTRTVLERGNRLGFRSASFDELAKKFDPEKLHYGCNTGDGEEIYYIPNPALGLWINREKF